MDDSPKETTVELIDLDILEESIGEFEFEEHLESVLALLEERHRELTIEANTAIKGRKQWLQGKQELLLPAQEN